MTQMIIDTPQPLNAHLLGLSEFGPFPTGHKLLITEDDQIDPVRVRSMKLEKTYDVQIFNRKNEFVDVFAVTYTYSKYMQSNVIVKHLGHY